MLLIALALAAALLLLVFLPIALQVDDWSRDLATNWAATSDVQTDLLLRPIHCRESPDEVVSALRAAVEDQPHWRLESVESADGPIVANLVRRTRWLGFEDDIRVEIVAQESATTVSARSQSRMGRGDLGQNPRNLRDLGRMLRSRLRPAESDFGAASDG